MRYRDGDWELFDYDIKTGRQVWSYDHGDGRVTYRTDYPVDPVIDENTAMRNMASSGWAGDYHKVASVPLNIFHDKIAPALDQQDEKYVSRWLNDADNAAWRTKEGRV